MSGPLITALELARQLTGANTPSLLDVRWQPPAAPDRGAYLDSHIPGAAFVDLDSDLADPPSERGRHPLPGAERFAAAMRTAGVWGARPVVVYDEATSMAAARAWWLLRYFGHQQVTVLDGGLAAWVAAGLPVEAGAAEVVPGDFSARPGQMPVLSAGEVVELARAGVLIDARTYERFRGESEPNDRVAGRVLGARNGRP